LIFYNPEKIDVSARKHFIFLEKFGKKHFHQCFRGGIFQKKSVNKR